LQKNGTFQIEGLLQEKTAVFFSLTDEPYKWVVNTKNKKKNTSFS